MSSHINFCRLVVSLTKGGYSGERKSKQTTLAGLLHTYIRWLRLHCWTLRFGQLWSRKTMETLLSLKVPLILLLMVHCVAAHGRHGVGGEQPLSKIAIHRALYALHENASIKVEPVLLGTKVTLMNFFCSCSFCVCYELALMVQW